MITKDDLYDIAFQYKKKKLWKKLWDNDVFALQLSGGETGYVSIMGQSGEYCAVGIYIGEDGFDSYRTIASADDYDGTDSKFKYHELLTMQNCLQAAFENKDYLRPEEADEVRAYAKAHGIRLSGKNSFPQFIKYEPGCFPWKVQNQDDMLALHEVLEASVLLADELKTSSPAELGITGIGPDTKHVPLFEIRDGKLVSGGYAYLPEPSEKIYDEIPARNELDTYSVKRLHANGIWEVELIRMIEPVQNQPEDVPYFPFFLMVVENDSDYLLPIRMPSGAHPDPQELLRYFADACRSIDTRPREIRCRDQRTYALLKDFCAKAKIKISVYNGPMVSLDAAEDLMFDNLTADDYDDPDVPPQMMEIIDAILSMDDSELNTMPEPVREQFRMLIEDDILPEDITARLREKLKDILW